jgi:hypothetical protein
MRLKVFLKLATNARIDTNFFAVLFVFIREFVAKKDSGSKKEFRHPAVKRVAHHRGTYLTGSHV